MIFEDLGKKLKIGHQLASYSFFLILTTQNFIFFPLKVLIFIKIHLKESTHQTLGKKLVLKKIFTHEIHQILTSKLSN